MPNAIGSMDMNMVMNMGLGAGGGMGTPSVVGAGTDSNNYMDVRSEQHRTQQGTVRVDHVFDAGDSLFARYSASSETGFMPQNLPGFGAYHDNMAQNGSLNWNHIFTPNLVNTVSAGVSRLTMFRQAENNATGNDIVSQLGIQGVGFGGAGAYGAPYFRSEEHTSELQSLRHLVC